MRWAIGNRQSSGVMAQPYRQGYQYYGVPMRGGKGSEHIHQRDVDCPQIGYGACGAPPQSMARWITTIHGRSARLDRFRRLAGEGKK